MPTDELVKEPELVAAEAALVKKSRAEKNTAPSVPGVYRCIANISRAIAKDGIGKDRSNQQQGYKFRGVDDLLNALAPLLPEHGLVILPKVIGRETVERASKSGGALFSTVLNVEFDFVCVADGSTHTVRVVGEAMDSADKSCSKAMSAAYKYCCFQTFCIPTEGENDADATTHDVAAQPNQYQGSTSKPWRPFGPTAPVPPLRGGAVPSDPNGGDSGTSDTVGIYKPGVVLIKNVDPRKTKNPNVTKYVITLSTGEECSTIKDSLAQAAARYRDSRIPVQADTEESQFGLNLIALTPVAIALPTQPPGAMPSAEEVFDEPPF
jgi:hypothetical protein